MRMQPEVEWIFFDMGGVLLDDAIAMQTARELLLAALQQENPQLTMRHIIDVLPQAAKKPGDLYRNIVALLITDPSEQERISLAALAQIGAIDYYATSSVRPDTRAVLQALAQHYKIGIIANQSIEAREKLVEADILPYFSYIGISRELNLSKPDPRIFEAAFRATRAMPECSVMIDDNIERGLTPAKRLGMKVAWYDLGTRQDAPDWIDFRIGRLGDLLLIF